MIIVEKDILQEHIDFIQDKTPKDEYYEYVFHPNNIDNLLEYGDNYAIISKDTHEPVFVGGLIKTDNHRAIAWAIFSHEDRKYFLSVYRVVKKFLTEAPYERIECTVDLNFQAAHRYAESLGFKLEAPRMAHFFAPEHDASLYSLCKGVDN